LADRGRRPRSKASAARVVALSNTWPRIVDLRAADTAKLDGIPRSRPRRYSKSTRIAPGDWSAATVVGHLTSQVNRDAFLQIPCAIAVAHNSLFKHGANKANDNELRNPDIVTQINRCRGGSRLERRSPSFVSTPLQCTVADLAILRKQSD
jgi:hypothetical protein